MPSFAHIRAVATLFTRRGLAQATTEDLAEEFYGEGLAARPTGARLVVDAAFRRKVKEREAAAKAAARASRCAQSMPPNEKWVRLVVSTGLKASQQHGQCVPFAQQCVCRSRGQTNLQFELCKQSDPIRR
eukprot:SAG22_NODE_882_length_6687_cov_5.782332_4_plen_130_part_00